MSIAELTNLISMRAQLMSVKNGGIGRLDKNGISKSPLMINSSLLVKLWTNVAVEYVSEYGPYTLGNE